MKSLSLKSHTGALMMVSALVFDPSVAAQQSASPKVYILPMAGGLDQYLAAQLAGEHILQVVADPKVADEVLTDRLGDSFEQAMVQLRPREQDKTPDPNSLHPSFRASGAKGTVFLVDVKSRQVLWSDVEKPSRSVSAVSLNREAARIAKKLGERGK